MHELSIAINIADIILEEIKKANASVLEKIEIDIGLLSGVIPEALDFALQEVFRENNWTGAIMKTNIIRAEAFCNSCKKQYHIDQLFDPCPFCDSFDNSILSGKELKIKSLTVS